MCRIPLVIPALLATALTPTVALGQNPPSVLIADQWRIAWENDTFQFGEGTDRHYTNGMRFEFTTVLGSKESPLRKFADWCPPTLCWAKALGPEGTNNTYDSATRAIGQSMFTSGDITRFEPDSLDRPFAGYLYGGVRVGIHREKEHAVSVFGSRMGDVSFIGENNTEFQLGLIGPLSLAGGAQAGMHIVRESRMPKGWRHQLGTEPTLQLLVEHRFGARLDPAFVLLPEVEIAPSIGAAFGTMQGFVSAGAAVRAGWNLTGLPTGSTSMGVQQGTPQLMPCEPWGIGVLATEERRFFGWNAFLDGGTLGGGPAVDRVSTITDRVLGVDLRFDPFTLGYRFVRRTQELAPLPGEPALPEHRFGQLSLTVHEQPDISKVGRAAAWAFDRAVLEGGFGSGFTKTSESTAEGLSTRFAVGFRLLGDTDNAAGVSFEWVGVADEASQPAPDGSHTDVFFNNRAVVAWFKVADPLGPGHPILRIGVGDALHKTQQIDGLERVDAEVSAARLLIGGSYELPLPFSNQVALGFDVTWSPVPLPDDFEDLNGSFMSTAIGLKWRPVTRSRSPTRSRHAPEKRRHQQHC